MADAAVVAEMAPVETPEAEAPAVEPPTAETVVPEAPTIGPQAEPMIEATPVPAVVPAANGVPIDVTVEPSAEATGLEAPAFEPQAEPTIEATPVPAEPAPGLVIDSAAVDGTGGPTADAPAAKVPENALAEAEEDTGPPRQGWWSRWVR